MIDDIDVERAGVAVDAAEELKSFVCVGVRSPGTIDL